MNKEMKINIKKMWIEDNKLRFETENGDIVFLQVYVNNEIVDVDTAMLSAHQEEQPND